VSTVPGRAFVGLDPNEKHPEQFHPGRVDEGPSLTLGRSIVGVLLGLAVIGAGYAFHTPGGFLSDCQKPHAAACQHQLGSGISMYVYVGVGVIVALVVVLWPYLRAGLKRRRPAG
jgi:hypothetical protein